MKTGIVMQIEGRRALVLKGDGSFVSVTAKSGWVVGETVSVSTVFKSGTRPLLALAACLAVVVLGGLGWTGLYSSPSSLISLDVNPSIELGVNRWGRIVSATALNEEGARILTEASTKNTSYQDALSNILTAEGQSGYLSADANLVLTVYARDAALQAALLSELEGLVDTQIARYSNEITTEYHLVDEGTVSGAHGHGVTAGKYLYLQELQTLVPQTDLSQYTHHSIEEIKSEIAACRQEHGQSLGEASHEEAHHGEEACD